MKRAPDNLADLALVLRRPDGGGPLRGVNLPRSELRHNLLLRPTDISSRLLKLSALSTRLPDVVLTPAQKATARKLSGGRYRAALRLYADGVSKIGEHVGAAEAERWPAAARLNLLGTLIDSYGAISRYAKQGMTRGMDQRSLIGAFQYYLLQLVLAAVVRRMEDPNTDEIDRSKLQNAFSGLLLRREQLLVSGDQRRQVMQKKKDQINEQVAESDRMTMVLDAIQAIRMNVPVDQPTLELVARYYEEERLKNAAAGGGGAGGAGGTKASGAKSGAKAKDARKPGR